MGTVRGGGQGIAGLACWLVLAACGDPKGGKGEAAGVPPVEIWIGGDVHWGDGAPGLEGVAALVGDGIGIVNLEGPVGASAEAGDGVRLHNAEAGLAGLRAAGVRVVGIANNHSGDRGSEGPGQTARAIRSAEMSPVGLGAGHVVVEAAGKRVVVTAHDLDAALGADLPTELAAARAEGDVLVATFHVTGPPSYLPRPELREAVDDALAAGARVVAAHGTHVVGPVERRGDVVIAWGLGNLLFSCDCTRDIDGAILRVSLRGDQLDARIIPIDAGLDGAAAKPAHDAPLMLDLFEALGSSKLVRDEARGSASF